MLEVLVHFDDDKHFILHDFAVIPQKGQILVWEDGRFTVEETGFVDRDGKMTPAIWTKGQKPSVYETRGVTRL